MLYLVHRVTISIKLTPVRVEQAVSESLPHKGLYTELLGVQLTCLDPVPASIRARNAQEINITNCDVTTWRWNLVHPASDYCPSFFGKSKVCVLLCSDFTSVVMIRTLPGALNRLILPVTALF